MISVIMPVYNTKQYLEQAIESVLFQTFQDWELILVDDGSTDGSGEMCDQYVKEDSRIRVIHQENKGLSRARNIGVQFATGEYIQFLDSDDWLYPETLKTAYETAVSSDSDMVIFDAQYEGENYSWHEKSSIPKGIYGPEKVLTELCRPSIPPYTWNKFCRRTLYEGVLFPEGPDGKRLSDAATTFYPVSRANRIAILDKPLYHYRQRSGSLTKQALKNRSLPKWRFIQYRKRYEFLKSNYPELADIAKESLFRNGLLYYSISLQGKKDSKAGKEIFDYLCSREFDEGITNKKLRFVRKGFETCPSIISYLIRRKFSARN